MLLSKSCHDLDILRWILGLRCTRVQSFGSLRLFREETKPAGATARCADGCTVETECPFSALRIYVRGTGWLHHKDTPGDDEASILEWLSCTNNCSPARTTVAVSTSSTTTWSTARP
jgi:hypothetical protein